MNTARGQCDMGKTALDRDRQENWACDYEFPGGLVSFICKMISLT